MEIARPRSRRSQTRQGQESDRTNSTARKTKSATRPTAASPISTSLRRPRRRTRRRRRNPTAMSRTSQRIFNVNGKNWDEKTNPVAVRLAAGVRQRASQCGDRARARQHESHQQGSAAVRHRHLQRAAAGAVRGDAAVRADPEDLLSVQAAALHGASDHRAAQPRLHFPVAAVHHADDRAEEIARAGRAVARDAARLADLLRRMVDSGVSVRDAEARLQTGLDHDHDQIRRDRHLLHGDHHLRRGVRRDHQYRDDRGVLTDSARACSARRRGLPDSSARCVCDTRRADPAAARAMCG